MSTCPNCGAELFENAKFCMECGTAIPQNKRCLKCGVELPPNAKFCFGCGSPQDGEAPATAGVNMGDKNVIAGDVIGQKIVGDNVGNKILGNAVFTTVQDDTKRVNTCAICGKHMTNDEGHTCPNCGKIICKEHFNNKKNICQYCVNEIIKKYKNTLYETWGDSKIKLSEKKKLEQLRMDAGLSLSDVAEIEKKYFFCDRIVVAIDGSGDFSSIKEALEYADDGITIFVKTGDYKEDITIEKSVQIIGERNGSEMPMISDVILIQNVNTNPTITNCAFFENIHISNGAQGIIENCSIFSGMEIQDSGTNPYIKNCEIQYTNQYVRICKGAQGSFENCDIPATKILIQDKDTNPTIKGCKIYDWGSISIEAGAQASIENCDISSGSIIFIQDKDTNPTIKGCMIHGCSVWISAGAQASIENCDISSGSSIFIQDKDTNPTIKGCKIHDGSDILIKAGAQASIENCDIFGNKNPGIAIQDKDTNPSIKGCMIHDGKQNGIWIRAGAQASIENCDIFGNEYPGIAIQDKDTNPSIKGCKIHDGKSNGLKVHNGAKGTIERCDFFKNDYPAFVIENTYTNPTIINCNFHNNAGVGIYILDGAAGNISSCSFSKNDYAFYFKGIETCPSIKNCTYLDNTHCCMPEVIKITAPPSRLDHLYVKNLVKEGDWVLLSQKVAEIEVINNITQPKTLSLSSPCYGIVESVHHWNGKQVHGGDTLISIREIW